MTNFKLVSTAPLYSSTYLAHHGIKGQKWGIRRYQNEDGSLTEAGKIRYGKQVKKLERNTIDKYYRDTNRSYVLRPYRTSTGKNYDKVVDDFQSSFKNDKKYKELSKKAFDAEKKRLLAEKKYINDDVEYNRFLFSPEGTDLYKKSRAAKDAKDDYVEEKAKKYIDLLKDAKLKDLDIPSEYSDIAKKYLKKVSTNDSDFYYFDYNLEYNPDSFYESWVDEEKFH